MGWKNVKEHYRIGHTVQVSDAGICIGSPYIHDIMVINKYNGNFIARYIMGGNEDLKRYQIEMDADPDKLKKLVTDPDQFSASIPVFTWKGGDILQFLCEVPGYPNITHDGQLMHENDFSTDRKQVMAWAVQSAENHVRQSIRQFGEAEESLAKLRRRMGDDLADLAKLRFEALLDPAVEISGTPETGDQTHD